VPGKFHSRLIGAFNAENLLGVLAVLLGFDVSLAQAIQALERCSAPPGRMETIVASSQPLIVVDYAHTPDALDKSAANRARSHERALALRVRLRWRP